ncbi:uncharacterized protein BCR38DRAFT_445271 [Pseudomassariella vexata]|uniref:Uncharacterized protein n=1 Tax=Pseudomassariella vexata TaxID=1141098 RepID=A0A1Y2DLX6_9PEZI|nr:uncharacterized protein BCR38DRAFT_445271 [Pseudomassariella vexata]ORY59705.1 hypothetical protein BCR38DRAFT_445271 [Pseudomassariella vexata]
MIPMAETTANLIPCRTQAIQRNFVLLCQYLNLGSDFDTGSQGLVQHMLQSSYIRPFFDEYTRDYLMEAEEIEDINLQSLQTWCKKKKVFTAKQYTSCRNVPDKLGWTALDHAARFVVQVLRYSWSHEGAWSHGDWDPDSDGESDLEFWQVCMVLRHLQAEWEAENLPDWDEDGLLDIFRELNLGRDGLQDMFGELNLGKL